ncbi:transposase [Nocardia sp. NPDC049707]|uniref:transposase n=1 Tax=Nocardia sp. NPDC049707 TaxID=3154735 RepID=UPI00341C3DFC
MLDAMFYLVRGGIDWRALPRDFPPPTTVYDSFRRWTKADVWQRINHLLRDRPGSREPQTDTGDGDHRLPIGARRRHCSHMFTRVGQR